MGFAVFGRYGPRGWVRVHLFMEEREHLTSIEVRLTRCFLGVEGQWLRAERLKSLKQLDSCGVLAEVPGWLLHGGKVIITRVHGTPVSGLP
jgi:hypothetical protein